jgi:5,6-dimethylbenzimidazole synthase
VAAAKQQERALSSDLSQYSNRLESSDLYDVINRRRDVRSEFTGQAPDIQALERILAAAHAAPSVGLTQPWDFILVRDEGLRRRFQAHVERERTVFEASLSGENAKVFSRIKIEGIIQAGLGIVVTYDPDRGSPAVLGRHAIADAGLYSTCLAIQNLWLAATAEGLGVGWVSFYREPFLQELLGIPSRLRPVAWLCVGSVAHLQDVPDLERHGWRERRPLADAVHFDAYGSSDR